MADTIRTFELGAAAERLASVLTARGKFRPDGALAYDPGSDAAYLKLLGGEHGRSADQRTLNIAGRGEIVLDFDLEEHLVGVEVPGRKPTPALTCRTQRAHERARFLHPA